MDREVYPLTTREKHEKQIKTFSRRRKTQLGCHGNFHLDENIRRSWYDPETILSNIGVKEGIVFVDVGCGDGFFSLLVARLAGKKGLVYAVDTDAQAIVRLETKAARQNLRNIKTVIGLAEETYVCIGCADIVFYSMVLHDFKEIQAVLRNAKKMLKPTGLLVNLDWKKQSMQIGPPYEIRFSSQVASELIEDAGFIITEVKDVGSFHYIVLAKSDIDF